VSEKVDLGQFVSLGQSIGVAYGVDLVEIDVPLEDEELAWFDIPDNPTAANAPAGSTQTTPAEVRADFAGAQHTWTGYVKRTTGQVDRTSRLVSVVVEVPEPFADSDSRPPLLPGMFVEVLIQGRVLKNAVAVPRDAIHNGNQVWVVENERLHVRALDIVRTDEKFAYATSGLTEGAAIIVSSLDIVVDGTKVRTGVETPLEADPLTAKTNKPPLLEAD
jgi:multidrug efflux pump subunit AcrA (membrane-fusion protein)